MTYRAGRFSLVSIAVTGAAVAAAFAAQRPSDPTHVPASAVVAALLAIALGALLPTPAQVTKAEVPATQGSRRARRLWIGSGLMLAPGLVAALVWSREPFRTHHLFIHASATWAALLWLAGIGAGLAYLWRTDSAKALPQRPSQDHNCAVRNMPDIHDPRISAPDDNGLHPTAVGVSLPLGCAVVAQESIHPAIVDRGRRPGRHAIFTLEAAALLAVVAVATALRAWHLGSLPDAIHYDEADSALTAERLLGLPFQPIAPTWGHNPSLYFYVMAALFRVAGDGIAVARLTSAIFGVLGVVAVYLVGRKIGGGAWGLCAAAVLAISRWSIHFSRFAESNIAAPLVITLCVAALAMAFARPGPFWFALYGVGLGLSALAYEGALLPAGATLCALGLHALTDARFRRAAWPAMLALPIGLVAGTLPFVTALAMDPGYVLWREHSMSLFTLAPDWPHRLSALRYTLRAHLLMFTVAGDAKGSDNVPWQPMLDAVTGACFLLGVGICLRRIRHWFYALLLLWLAASLLSGILSNPGDAPSAPRTVTAVAPLALIAALPLAALATLVANLLVGLRAPHGQVKGYAAPGRAATARTVRANLVAALVVAVPLGAALAQNVQEYFEVYPDSLIAWQEMDGPLTLLGRAIPLLVRQGYTISVDPLATWRGQVIAYTAGFLPAAYDPDRPIAPPPRGRGLALAIPASYSDVPPDFFADMHAIYPTARVITLAPAFDPAVVQYRIMLIPAAEVGHHAGVAVGPGRRPRANAQRRGAMRRTTGSGHGRS